MEKAQKERLVAELTERLQSATTLLVADYRGLSMAEIDALRTEVLKHGATFRVVKNTLTRRAAEAAGQDALLTLLEGPTAIAFLESDGDPVAVAKALADAARTTRILAIRGGLLEGRPITREDVDDLAKLPPTDVLRGQVLGAILAPLHAIAGLVNAPLQNLYGLIEARIDQLEQGGGTAGAGDESPAEEPQASVDAQTGESVAEEAAAEAVPPADESTAPTEAEVTEATEERAEGSPDIPEETQE